MRSYTMQAIIGTQYFKNSEVIVPGKVGSVGDVLASVRLKQSTPDMAMRYDKSFSGIAESLHGSNVQDGYSYSFTSGGGPARTLDSRLERKSFKTNHGWVYQDLRVPDTTLEPIMGSTGRYDWYNRVANTYQAKITGDMFLPLPGEYRPTSMTRGNQIPRIIATDIGVYSEIAETAPKDQPKEEMKDVATEPTFYQVCEKTGGSSKKPPPGQRQTTATPPSTPATTAPTVGSMSGLTGMPSVLFGS